MFLAERNPFFALDLPFRFGVVEEEHHRGLVIYRAVESSAVSISIIRMPTARTA